HDLEEEYFLAVRLEAKVSGLDDARVHRTDRYLVHLVAVETIERIVATAERARGQRRPAGRFVVRRMPAQWFEPRMPCWSDAALLRHLALERRGLLALNGEGRITLADDGARRAKFSSLVVSDHSDHAQRRRVFGCAKERDDAPSVGDRHADCVAKRFDRQRGNIREPHGAAVTEPSERLCGRPRQEGGTLGHGARPPSAVAALDSASVSGLGRYT